MSEVLEILKAGDGYIAVAVLVYFGTQLNRQMADLQQNQFRIIELLIKALSNLDDRD